MDRPWIRHYDPDVRATLDYPDIALYRLLEQTAATRPDAVATTLNDTDITYGELDRKVNRFAHALAGLGVAAGDRVALVLPNSPTYVIAFYAALKLGAVAVNLSVAAREAEMGVLLAHCDPKVVVTLDLFLKTVLAGAVQAAPAAIVVHSVFGLEKELQVPAGVPAPRVFNELTASGPESAPGCDAGPADLAVLQYTSGTTGTPKAVMLTHRNLVANVLQIDQWCKVERADNPAVICILPFFHVFGLTACLNLSVYKGYRMILVPIFSWSSILPFLKMIKTYRPISFPAVPSLWAALVSFPEVTAYPLGSIRVPSSGGAPLEPWVQERFASLTGNRILQAYGLSEASAATHMVPFSGASPAGSMGLPLPDTEARIVDSDTGTRPLPPGEIGELVVRGPQIMQGYWRRPDATREALRDGWLYTGDLARMDADGFFTIVERKDDLIITHGFNVYPNEIESVLKRHPGVRSVAVVGVADRLRGQSIVAYVVPDSDRPPTREDLLAHCRRELPDHKVPRWLNLVDEIPQSPVGKPLRKSLRDAEYRG